MRKSRNILNNLMLGTLRKNQIYQAIITDLAITDNIDRGDAEMLLGYKIPGYLKTPDGQHFEDSEDEPDDGSGDEDGNIKSNVKNNKK